MPIELNKKQLEAVKYRGGPLMIIAGAGTGKTAMLTSRIIDIIKSGDAQPSEILALTFTEKAASEMVERVDVAMPIGYEEISISTFHSFCDSILRQDGVYLGLDTGYSLMTQAQSYILFRRHLFDFPLESLRPMGNPVENINHMLKHFSRLQDEDVFPKEYLDYVDTLPRLSPEEEQEYNEAKQLAETYQMYEKIKIENSKLDFGDLIMQTLRLFRERPNILARYNKRYKYILVDEFQDTNFTQNALVNIIALNGEGKGIHNDTRKNANITVVGDDDQAIYKFRGAAISNILHFKSTYPSAKKVVLNENYRSKQEILDASYNLIQFNNPSRLEVTEDIDKRLDAKGEFSRNGGHPIRTILKNSAYDEADAIVSEILRISGNSAKIKERGNIVNKQFDDLGQSMFVDVDKGNGDNYKYSEMAILVRAHSHADDIVQALRYAGVPYKFGGPKGLYTRPEVSLLISYLKLLADYSDDVSTFNILTLKRWGLTSREIAEINRVSKRKKESIFESLEDIMGIKVGSDEGFKPESIGFNNLGVELFSEEAQAGLRELFGIINTSLHQLRNAESVGYVLLSFLKGSGIAESLLDSADIEDEFRAQNIAKYFQTIKQFEDDNKGTILKEYVDFLEYSIDTGDTPSTDIDMLEDYNAVNILSVHGAKGLEFPVVFLPSIVSERFPARNRKDSLPIPSGLIKDVLPDVDQKTEHLMEERRLFYVGSTRAKERLYLSASRYYGNAKRKKKLSQFLGELLGQKVEEEFSGSSDVVTLDSSIFRYNSNVEDSLVLNLDDLGPHNPSYISYSHIDTYLSCPKKYRYRYVLGLPGPESSTLAFGRTIHSTLRSFYSDFMNRFSEEYSVADRLIPLDALLSYYEEKWLSEGYSSKRHEQLRKDMGRELLTTYHMESYDPARKPLGLEVVFKYKLEDVIIKGSIDRIDLLEESDTCPVVELIDYKTGSLKEQKDVDENLQLAIYALVAEESLGYKVGKASLIFIEHGVKISTEINDFKKEAVKSKVREVLEMVKDRKFEATPSYMCKFCDYRDICKDALIVTG